MREDHGRIHGGIRNYSINEYDTGMILELERRVDTVTLGIDVVYNPACADGEAPLMIAEEYVKR